MSEQISPVSDDDSIEFEPRVLKAFGDFISGSPDWLPETSSVYPICFGIFMARNYPGVAYPGADVMFNELTSITVSTDGEERLSLKDLVAIKLFDLQFDREIQTALTEVDTYISLIDQLELENYDTESLTLKTLCDCITELVGPTIGQKYVPYDFFHGYTMILVLDSWEDDIQAYLDQTIEHLKLMKESLSMYLALQGTPNEVVIKDYTLEERLEIATVHKISLTILRGIKTEDLTFGFCQQIQTHIDAYKAILTQLFNGTLNEEE